MFDTVSRETPRKHGSWKRKGDSACEFSRKPPPQWRRSACSPSARSQGAAAPPWRPPASRSRAAAPRSARSASGCSRTARPVTSTVANPTSITITLNTTSLGSLLNVIPGLGMKASWNLSCIVDGSPVNTTGSFTGHHPRAVRVRRDRPAERGGLAQPLLVHDLEPEGQDELSLTHWRDPQPQPDHDRRHRDGRHRRARRGLRELPVRQPRRARGGLRRRHRQRQLRHQHPGLPVPERPGRPVDPDGHRPVRAQRRLPDRHRQRGDARDAASRARRAARARSGTRARAARAR